MFDADSRHLEESDHEDSVGGRTRTKIVVGKDDEVETDDSVRPSSHHRRRQQRAGRWGCWGSLGHQGRTTSSSSVTSDVTDDGTVGSLQAAYAGLRRTLNTCFLACMEHPSAPRYWIVGLAMAMGIAFAVHLTSSKAGDGDDANIGSSGSAVFSSIDDQRRNNIYNLLGSISGEALRDSSSDQFRAAHWITDRDEMQLKADDPYLAQRYALAVVYYALNLDQHFADGGGGGEERWLDFSSECDWAGIRCNDDDFVTEIHLGKSYVLVWIFIYPGTFRLIHFSLTTAIPMMGLFLQKTVNMRVKNSKTKPGLSGTIPNEISVLSELHIVDLRNNQIYGKVNDRFGSLSNLHQLLLDNNALSGTVSPAICKLVDNGSLSQFTTDCVDPNPSVDCSCCTNCVAVGSVDIGAVVADAEPSDCLEGGGKCEDGYECCSALCMGDGTCM